MAGLLTPQQQQQQAPQAPQAPQQAEQPGEQIDPEQVARGIVQGLEQLKGIIDPEIFQNFISTLAGAAQPQEEDLRQGPISMEGGAQGVRI